MEKPLARPFFIRNLDAGQLLETFLVSAVAAFLGVRFFLGVTGYPRLGGGGHCRPRFRPLHRRAGQVHYE